MSSRPVSHILSSLAARFKQLKNRLQTPDEEEKSVSQKQASYSTRCANVSKSETEETSTATTVDWWARLYRGLVIDEKARHYRQMGQAVWLFLYFLLNANWKTGRLYRRLRTISADTGINIFAIRRWLRVLQRNGYINACYNGRFWIIAVNKWKPVQSLFMMGVIPRQLAAAL